MSSAAAARAAVRLRRAQVRGRIERDKQIALTVERNRTVHAVESWMGRRHAVDDQFRFAGGHQFVAAKREPIHAGRRARVEPIVVEPDAGAAIDRAEMLDLVRLMVGIQMKRDDAASLLVPDSAESRGRCCRCRGPRDGGSGRGLLQRRWHESQVAASNRRVRRPRSTQRPIRRPGQRQTSSSSSLQRGTRFYWNTGLSVIPQESTCRRRPVGIDASPCLVRDPNCTRPIASRIECSQACS